jgi:hypothetical protein
MIISNRFRKWRVEIAFQETTSVLATSLVHIPLTILVIFFTAFAISIISITAYKRVIIDGYLNKSDKAIVSGLGQHETVSS